MEKRVRDYNSLKSSGKYVSPALTISNSAVYIDGFYMILNVNRDYFLKQQ
jgi:hypothetical protein